MTKTIRDRGVLCACAATPVAMVDGKPAKRIQLLPMGKFTAAGWGDYEVAGKADAERIVAATRAHLGATEMMADYDHQVLYAIGKDKGGQAVAAGWIDPASIVVEDTGIWGDVTWTPLAEQRLTDREYRYVSPTFIAKAPRIERLHNFALVNTPAIKELAAAAAEIPEEKNMKTIAAALGLSETATEAEICTAIVALNTSAAAGVQLAAAAEALGLGKEATGEQIVAAAVTLKTAGEPDPTKFAPMSLVTDLQTQLGQVVAATATDKATAAVDAAIAAGKVQPAHRDHFLRSAAKDLANFESYVAAAAVIIPIGERTAAGKVESGDLVALSDADKSLCVQMGWDQAAFLETRKQENA